MVVLLVLAACSLISDAEIDDKVGEGEGTECDAPATWYADVDGDRYGDLASAVEACDAVAGMVEVAGDCDDANPAVHPGATEADCNDATDYNCDGSTGYDDADADGFPACEDCDDGDAGVTAGEAWYADTDGDGYGDDSAATTSCSAPPDHVSDATDCDDADGSAYPGADETCDGVDDNCNGETDESAIDAATWYADMDGDGYGDVADAISACDAPEGYLATDTDCDDTDAAYNPGALEDDCTDPADYNCDGTSGYIDGDGDGFAACEECDDADASEYPGAAEICDGDDDDCDGAIDEDDAIDLVTWYADADGDGYGDAATSALACDAPSGFVSNATDCDDGSAVISPFADELCNGLDDNCDGDVDQSGAIDAPTWYADADGDGYGDASDSMAACEAPSGYLSDSTDCDDADDATFPGAASNDSSTSCMNDDDGDNYGDTTSPSGGTAGTDCDDTRSSAHPGATEMCDGDDHDCDGQINEADSIDAAIWYADSDNDGFGNAETEVPACDAPAGFVSDASDCDDAAAAVNPGEAEVCENGIDDDCDSGAGGCAPASASLSTAVQFSGEAAGDNAGIAVSGAGDVDGDGYDDILVGASGNDEGGSASGAAYLILGSPSSASASLSSAVQFAGEAAYDQAGFSVSGAGDIDGDGYDDILVSAHLNDEGGSSAGAAYLVLGSPSPAPASLSSAVQFVGEAVGDYAGVSVSGAGDTDGDGYRDILVGAFYSDEGGTSAGAAYLVLGSASPATASLSSALRFAGKAAADNAGGSVSCAGDVDGDGYDDFLVGAEYNDDGGSSAGAAHLILGSASPASANLSLAAAFAGEAAGDLAGGSVAGAGDVDGDGYDDFLVGALGNDDGGSSAGAAYLVLGSASPASVSLSSAVQFTGEAEDDGAGISVTGAGDIDGDGYFDVAIGARGNDDGGSSAGAVYVVLGSASPTPASLSSAVQFSGETAGDYAGQSGAGDIDADGHDDLVVGAHGNDDGAGSAGAAYLLFGTGL